MDFRILDPSILEGGPKSSNRPKRVTSPAMHSHVEPPQLLWGFGTQKGKFFTPADDGLQVCSNSKSCKKNQRKRVISQLRFSILQTRSVFALSQTQITGKAPLLRCWPKCTRLWMEVIEGLSFFNGKVIEKFRKRNLNPFCYRKSELWEPDLLNEYLLTGLSNDLGSWFSIYFWSIQIDLFD